MFWFLYFMMIYFSILSYITSDPIKRRLFLVFSLVFCVPLMTFFVDVWFSYFICILFLSGVFVILVYISSLSSHGFRSYLKNVFLIIFMLVGPIFQYFFEGLSIKNLYFDSFFIVLAFILVYIYIFLNFTSYIIAFSGALRRV